jgi:glutamate-ammonia-ligase adenylyltransferase
MTRPLLEAMSLVPPLIDAEAGARCFEALPETARAAVAPARDFLEAVFAAAPYLARLAAQRPETLARGAEAGADVLFDEVLAQTRRLGAEAEDAAALDRGLRAAKADAHLLSALADIAGDCGVLELTGAMTRFADAATAAALHAHVRFLAARGACPAPADPDNPLPGLFLLALGKMGAGELNYSSDIDLVAFYDTGKLPLSDGEEARKRLPRLIKAIAASLQERTAEGYVFRVDLRLRPDPGATPPAVSVEAALHYYESLGQTWERAAYIKARRCAGDPEAAAEFLAELQPFIWRRALDFAAVDDIRGLARQIQTVGRRAEIEAAGHDLKLGRGGIREIEFFAQVPQLVFGGREAGLRRPATLQALEALAAQGAASAEACAELAADYLTLRAIEHRIQMRQDEDSQTLPQDDEERRAVAALDGEADLSVFDAEMVALMRRVHGRFSDQFQDDETLASSAGSFVLTGVEPTPDTVATLERLGFADPQRVWKRIQGWISGRARAARTARGRGLLTRLAPRLVDMMAGTGEPDAAFTRFAAFYESLPMGVQPLSLMVNEPGLAADLIGVITLAPRMAADLARRPDLLDIMLDRRFATPLAADAPDGFRLRLETEIDPEDGFEAALNTARRAVREERFRIGAQVLRGAADAQTAGAAFADVADAVVEAMAKAAEAETVRRFGPPPGAYCILGLGKLGGRELSADSDLDLMVVYEPDAETHPEAATWFTRFAQRFVSALSAPTEEGGLYEADMQLRPSGRSGPVAVQFKRFASYYRDDAWTWEMMALTRARPVAGDPRFCEEVMVAAEAALRHERSPDKVRADAADMRARLEREKPARSEWSLKARPGGLIDVEFIAQALQVAAAPQADVVRDNTAAALAALAHAGEIELEEARFLAESGRLYLGLAQLIRSAHGAGFDPAEASAGFADALSAAGGAEDMRDLSEQLQARCDRARALFERYLGPVKA